MWADASYLIACGAPTSAAGARFVRDALVASALLRALAIASRRFALPATAPHVASLALGAFLLHGSVGFAFLWTAALAVGAYCSLLALGVAWPRRRGVATCALALAFSLAAERWSGDARAWQRIRGVQMLVAMKAMSVALDVERGFEREPPSPAAFAGYAFCPATCALGPWTSFREYSRALDARGASASGVRAVVANAAAALVALFASNCVAPWAFGEGGDGGWLGAYRDAAAFRASHYFVSLTSTATTAAGGFARDERDPDALGVRVAAPLDVELPRSLVRVVVAWNAPMRRFLKTYAFDALLPRYGAARALLATYALSSALHGLNFQLSAALLSIGLFSYVEYGARATLADALDACCRANECSRSCSHRRRRLHPLTIAVNVAFGALAALQLAYLGVMFEASFAVQESGYSYSHALRKWAELSFAGHSIALALFALTMIVRSFGFGRVEKRRKRAES